MKIHAIYEAGVFRPTEHVDLPEHAEVEFEPEVVNGQNAKPAAMQEIYQSLSESCETGIRDLAARHNEHHFRAAGLVTLF